MSIHVSWYLIVSAIIFTIGVTGVLIRRNPLIIFMSIELMLNAVNLSFIAFSHYLNSVDGFIFNSATTREAVHALVEAGKPHLVATPGGDRLGSLSPDAIRARAAGPGPLRLLFLANVTPLKGLHVLLEAIRLQTSDIRLDVIGSLAVDEKYAQRMQQESDGLGPKSKVVFHGILDGGALIEKLKQAQALGDLEALQSRRRPVLRVHLADEVPENLGRLEGRMDEGNSGDRSQETE